MKIGKLFVFCTLALVLLLSAAGKASAVNAVLSLYDVGSNTYLLDCNAVNDISTMDITFEYDAGSMENVKAVQGTFLDGRGTISIIPSGSTTRLYARYTPPVSGNGHIAVITYTPKQGRAGNIISLRGTFVNSSGKTVPVDVQPISNPQQPIQTDTTTQTGDTTTQTGDTTTQTGDTTTQTGGAATQTGGTTTQTGGAATQTGGTTTQTGGAAIQVITGAAPSVSVIMPTDTVTPDPRRETSATTDAQSEPAPPLPSEGKAAESSAKAGTAEVDAASGILERFKNYRGERSIQAFAALFRRTSHAGITQEPWIVLSDGTAKATLIIKGQSSLNYSLQKAKRRSLKKAGENSWNMEVLPDKGTYQAALTLRQGSSNVTFPLTVAPPVKVTENDLSVYFVERAKGSHRFDLNGDGVINYIDDYIFTANYLAARQKGAGEAGK